MGGVPRRWSAVIAIALGVFVLAAVAIGFGVAVSKGPFPTPPVSSAPTPTVSSAPTPPVSSAPATTPPSTPTATASPITAPAAPSAQSLYATKLRQDYQSLDRGVLTYTPIGHLKTGATTLFEVMVTDVGRGTQRLHVTQSGGWAVYQKDVPAGGIVGVQIVNCENLICQSESSVVQPVLFRGLSDYWSWVITPVKPGLAAITLRADTYDQGSDQTLSEEIIRVNGMVEPTAPYVNHQHHEEVANTAKSVVGDIITIGSVATALLAIGGIVGWIFTRRRRHGNSDSQSAAPSTGNSEGGHERPDGSPGTSQQQPPDSRA